MTANFVLSEYETSHSANSVIVLNFRWFLLLKEQIKGRFKPKYFKILSSLKTLTQRIFYMISFIFLPALVTFLFPPEEIPYSYPQQSFDLDVPQAHGAFHTSAQPPFSLVSVLFPVGKSKNLLAIFRCQDSIAEITL